MVLSKTTSTWKPSPDHAFIISSCLGMTEGNVGRGGCWTHSSSQNKTSSLGFKNLSVSSWYGLPLSNSSIIRYLMVLIPQYEINKIIVLRYPWTQVAAVGQKKPKKVVLYLQGLGGFFLQNFAKAHYWSQWTI